jgi:hypothetical protein
MDVDDEFLRHMPNAGFIESIRIVECKVGNDQLGTKQVVYRLRVNQNRAPGRGLAASLDTLGISPSLLDNLFEQQWA